MKTRIALSLAATLIAIGAALATNVSKGLFTIVTVAANSSTTTCPVSGSCDDATTQDLCLNGTTQQFIISSGTCTVAAKGIFKH